MQVADGLMIASARATTKMEAKSAEARARTPPNERPRPVSRAVMMAASGAKRGAGALAFVADKVRHLPPSLKVFAPLVHACLRRTAVSAYPHPCLEFSLFVMI